MFTGKNAEAHKNFIDNKQAVERLITNSTESDDIFRDLRELFDWYQDKEALDNSEFGKIGKFIDKELRKLIKNPPQSLQEKLDRKLELLINNYINNRKQKWQRKTT